MLDFLQEMDIQIACPYIREHMRQSLESLVRSRLGSVGVAFNRRIGFAKVPPDVLKDSIAVANMPAVRASRTLFPARLSSPR